MIGRDNQNRIRWGNLLTLPVAQGGLLYVEPVYASPGASDAASSYPRLIRVAMMYNDKVGYGPTVQRCARPSCSGRVREPPPPGRRRPMPPNGQPPAAPPPADGQPPAAPPPSQQGRAPEVPVPVAVPPGGGRCSCRRRKPLRCKTSTRRWTRVHQAQQSGNFAEYGAGAAAPRRCDEQVQQRQVSARVARGAEHAIWMCHRCLR